MDILAEIIEEEATIDGQLPNGFLFASFKNVGDTIATVNGVSLAVGEAKSYPFVGKGYKAVTYSVNGSRLRIMRIV
jgi:hypothetical protein